MRTPAHKTDLTSVAVDRRRSADRRSYWRGGRRDSDWLTRPAGALEILDHGARPMAADTRWRLGSVFAWSLPSRHA